MNSIHQATKQILEILKSPWINVNNYEDAFWAIQEIEHPLAKQHFDQILNTVHVTGQAFDLCSQNFTN